MSTAAMKITEQRQARGRYDAGVLKYREMGYWHPVFAPKDTVVIGLFRITPLEGVEPE